MIRLSRCLRRFFLEGYAKASVPRGVFVAAAAMLAVGGNVSKAATPLPFKSSSSLFQAAPPLVELNFELVGGRIYVPAEVNGHMTAAVLDSGAGSTVMDLGLADKWNLPSSGSLTARGGGGATVQGKFLRNTTITLGGIVEPLQIAIPLQPLDTMEGRHVETIVGYHFFKTHTVEIDYKSRHLRIFDSESNFRPAGVSVPLKIVGSLCHITSKMRISGTDYKLETLVDTGASGSALSTKFLDKQPLHVHATPLTDLGAGVGGVSRGQLFRSDRIEVGSTSFNHPIIAMTESGGGVVGKTASFDLLLGAEVLQRFVVTFDYSHSQLFLAANTDASKPFEADKTGLRIFAEGDNLRRFRVVGVLPGSTAEESGIKPNDIIERIDDTPASNFSLQELRERLRSSTVKAWSMGLKRGTETRILTVKARPII